MKFLRKIFGLVASKTPLNNVKRVTTSKLPIPDVGGEYYIRFTAKKMGSKWNFDYETNCKFKCFGKTKSMEAFEKAKENHLKGDEDNICLETVIIFMADLENAHLRYSDDTSTIEQDKKTKKHHYIHVLDKMPDALQDIISKRWNEYVDEFGMDSILKPKQKETTKPKRALPAKRVSRGNGRGHRH